MPNLLFKDAVNPAGLDPNAEYAVYYMDGIYENEAAVRRQCPKAKLFAITTKGATGKGVFACDSETGDMSVPQTVAWVAEQVRLNVELIVPYANQDRWLNLGLLAALAKYGNRIERWDADYNGSTTMPSWASAKQYATGSVDRDVALANFFTGITPVPKPHGKVRVAVTMDIATGKVTAIHPLPGFGVHFAGPEKWLKADVEIQVGRGGGKWR
jgi:hypothetical protein